MTGKKNIYSSGFIKEMTAMTTTAAPMTMCRVSKAMDSPLTLRLLSFPGIQSLLTLS